MWKFFCTMTSYMILHDVIFIIKYHIVSVYQNWNHRHWSKENEIFSKFRQFHYPYKSSTNSLHVQKCGISEILKRVADSRKSTSHTCPLWKLKWLLLLRKSGQNSRQVCWRQQRRCVAQQSPTNGDVKLWGGIRKMMMPSQLSFQSTEGWQMHTSII